MLLIIQKLLICCPSPILLYWCRIRTYDMICSICETGLAMRQNWSLVGRLLILQVREGKVIPLQARCGTERG